MSTRCDVTIYQLNGDEWKEGPILYHHWDGYPEAMVPKLESLLWQASDILGRNGYCFDAEKVAAIMVARSEDTSGYPAFQPCRHHHDDLEYKYDVYADHHWQIVAKHRDGGSEEWAGEIPERCC